MLQREQLLPSSSPIQEILNGEWQETEVGLAFVKETRFEPDRHHGKAPLGALLGLPPETLAMLLGGSVATHPSELAFFDVETTGLSGGTGTYVFLAGLGSFVEGAFLLRQYFLADMESERAMLSLLVRDLSRFKGLVSYNGRAFDMPLLETRMTLSRLRNPCRNQNHLDLLHTVRRLYRRRWPSCRLADAEKHLLGVERVDDMPGHLIPSCYFDYIRAGRASQLKRVFRHNADDILSIACCLAFVGALFSRANLDGSDALALAHWWELRADVERAKGYYRAALPLLYGSPEWAWAARRYATILKRAGSIEDAVELWRRLWGEGDPEAGLELAKHWEHREHDFAAAEAAAAALLERSSEAERLALEHRLARILRKKALALRPAPCPTT